MLTLHQSFLRTLGSTLISIVVSVPLSALTLEDAIKLALEGNPSILANTSAMASSKEAIDVARAGYFPSVDLTNSGGYQYTKERSKLTPFSSAFNAQANRLTNNLALTFSQTIFNGFETINQVKQAKSQFAASSKTVEKTQEEIALQACFAFYTIISQQELIKVSQENIAAHEKILAKISERVQGGLGTRADIEQAQARLANAYVALTFVQGELERAIADFMDVVGIFPKDLTETPLPVSKIPETLNLTVDAALAKNPSILVAQQQFEVAIAQFDQTEAPFWPNLSFETSTAQSINPTGALSNTGTVSVSLVGTYNFFNGGGDIATRRAQREKVVESKYQISVAQRAIERDTQAAWADRETAVKRLKELTKALEIKKQLVEDYNIQFDLGDRSLVDTLDAERGYYESKADYVVTNAVISISEAKLLSFIAQLASSYKRREAP